MALSHRVERIQEQVREEVSQMLATEVRDPGVGLVTVTRAKVTGDLSLARVYWTIIGDAAERKKTAKALERAAGFIRHLLAERLSLRRVPEVKFIFDESVGAQDRIEQIIQEIHAEDAARTVDDPGIVDTVADGKDATTVKNDEPARLSSSQRIKQGQRFVVASHQRPDGDAIGSAMAMALALRAIGQGGHGRHRRHPAGVPAAVSRRRDRSASRPKSPRPSTRR